MRARWTAIAALALVGCSARRAGPDRQPVGLRSEGGLAYYANNDNLTVVSPWAKVSEDFEGPLTVGGGWEADVISAATVDVVSSATQPFEEVRNEGQAEVSGDWSDLRISGSYFGSLENDTLSHTLSSTLERDLFSKNLTLGLTYGQSRYKVGTVHEPRELWRPRVIHQLDASASQLLSPRTIVTSSYTFQYLSGSLANPYLMTPIFPSDEALWTRTDAQWVYDSVPDTRARHAINLGGRQALGEALYLWGGWQGYLDTWAMRGNTGDLGLGVEALDGLMIELTDRFHWQSSVSFYRSVYTVNRDYITRDRRLGKLMSNSAGLSLRLNRGSWEAILSSDLQWTRYVDYQVVTDEGLVPMPDNLATVDQLGLAYTF